MGCCIDNAGATENCLVNVVEKHLREHCTKKLLVQFGQGHTE